jgi:hypothetical protein
MYKEPGSRIQDPASRIQDLEHFNDFNDFNDLNGFLVISV